MSPASPSAATAARTPHPGMGPVEFIALMAAIMATGALGIDAMLPALSAIGHALGVADANTHQWIVTAYMLGMGVAQLVYGPVTDRYGRKWVLIVGLALYTVFGAAAAFAPSFEALLLARVMQGVGAAGARVLATSIVRDCYDGNRMARVMSLAFLVFLAVPIVAPSLGQLILMVAPWPWVFSMLALSGLAVLIWVALRLPETLAAAHRQPIEWRSSWVAVRAIVSDRQSVGYTVAMTLISGPLFGFINSAPQLFDQTFHASQLFPMVFAGIASGVAIASLLNARIVERLGMHRVSHLALIAFVAVSALHALVVLLGMETLASFAVLQALMMFCFGLLAGNFGAMAMAPMGRIAGMASAVQGFFSTVFGALLGFGVGQMFDGTVLPLAVSQAVLGAATFAVVMVAERGVLFRNVESPADLGSVHMAH